MGINQGQNSVQNVTKKFGLLLYVVTWGLIQFKKGILSDAENSNFIVT